MPVGSCRLRVASLNKGDGGAAVNIKDIPDARKGSMIEVALNDSTQRVQKIVLQVRIPDQRAEVIAHHM